MAGRPRVSIRVVRADGGPESVVAMRGDALVCGRTGDLTLPNDPFVAEAQLRLFFSDNRLAVEDVGGHNGVFVRLHREILLAPKSEIRVGRQRLLLEELRQAMPAPDGAIAWGSADGGFRYRLVQYYEGGYPGRAFMLKPGDNSLGREKGDITFPGDGFVSGKHAIISVTSDQVTLRDLGSANGTFVRLTAPAFVENQNQFLVGRELVRVEVA